MKIKKFARPPPSPCGRSKRPTEVRSGQTEGPSALPDSTLNGPAHLLSGLAIVCCEIRREKVDPFSAPENDDFFCRILVVHAARKGKALGRNAVDFNPFDRPHETPALHTTGRSGKVLGKVRRWGKVRHRYIERR